MAILNRLQFMQLEQNQRLAKTALLGSIPSTRTSKQAGSRGCHPMKAGGESQKMLVSCLDLCGQYVKIGKTETNENSKLQTLEI